ncbi:unnamed protein product [Danaus chrysippus]|uniref:(African queen) hypothetical protein n=1 Tax=Danaus chrysippus TaxID=151541 RepID=A0A8J2VVX2_9NEOP|nr:unnamed protein product [Danaus chrysippus]
MMQIDMPITTPPPDTLRCIPEFVLENVVVLITMSRRTVGAITDEADMAGTRLAECLEAMLPNHPDDQQPLSNIAFFYREQNIHNVQITSSQTSEANLQKRAHFADWSTNSSEFHILLEVKREFIEQFISSLSTIFAELGYYRRVCGPEADGIPRRTTLEGWLARWALQLSKMKRFNNYLILDYRTYVHCFTNWLMGKNPNGPGQWVLVPPTDPLPQPPFPVDYSALKTEPVKLEPYAPDKKTNRHSVIV